MFFSLLTSRFFLPMKGRPEISSAGTKKGAKRNECIGRAEPESNRWLRETSMREARWLQSYTLPLSYRPRVKGNCGLMPVFEDENMYILTRRKRRGRAVQNRMLDSLFDRTEGSGLKWGADFWRWGTVAAGGSPSIARFEDRCWEHVKLQGVSCAQSC